MAIAVDTVNAQVNTLLNYIGGPLQNTTGIIDYQISDEDWPE